MSMSKKDFIALADVMSYLHKEIEKDRGSSLMRAGRFEQWQITKMALLEFCTAQNPRFMRDRWLAYIAGECGPNGGKAVRSCKANLCCMMTGG